MNSKLPSDPLLRPALMLCLSLSLVGASGTGCAGEDDSYQDTGDEAVGGGTGVQGGIGNGTNGGAPGSMGTTGGGATGNAADDAAGGDMGFGTTPTPGSDDGAGSAGTTGGAEGDVNGAAPGTVNDDTSGVVDSGGPSGESGAGAGLMPRGDLGEGDGSDVIMIGDSWMSLFVEGSGIQGGVLKASSQPYRQYAVGGTTLLGGGIVDLLGSIPVQYQNAKGQDPEIQTVIMTGGGNDILQTGLQADCEQLGEACGEQVIKILDGLSMLWAEMAADGVQDVVYILYSRPNLDSVDFALPDGDSAVARCADVPAPLRCHILPTADIVMGEIGDGIHPTQAASDRVGQAVYDLMIAQGMRR